MDNRNLRSRRGTPRTGHGKAVPELTVFNSYKQHMQRVLACPLIIQWRLPLQGSPWAAVFAEAAACCDKQTQMGGR